MDDSQAAEDRPPDLILLDVVLPGQADGALVTIYEGLAWQVSGPQMRQAKPPQPSAAWQKVSRRWHAKEAPKK